jgi:trehalose/maltose transport system permease protein
VSARGRWLWVPALAALGFLTLYPLARTLAWSLTDARLATLDHPHWLGLENYAYLLRDPDWWRAVANTAAFTLASVTLETLLGLAVALLLDSRLRGRGALRAAMLVPWAIPAVVSARLWAWIFDDLHGVVNEALRWLGGSGQIPWLADDRLVLVVLVLVDAWKATPFMALLLLAGLQSIPAGVREAARVDGATPWQEFFRVRLPLLRPALAVAVLFRTLDALRVFDLPFVLTSNSRGSAVMSTYARQQMIDFQEVGYGSAAAGAIFCLTALLALAYLRLARGALGLGPEGGER